MLEDEDALLRVRPRRAHVSVAKQLGITEPLFQLVDRAFDSAIPILREPGEPFSPFVLAEGGDKPLLQRFIAPGTELAVKSARVAVGRMPPEAVRYALVFDGRVTLAVENHDAVIVEAGDCGSDFGVAFALRYRPATANGQEFVEVGNPKFLGRVGNCFVREQDA